MKTKNVLCIILVNPPGDVVYPSSKHSIYRKTLSDIDIADVHTIELRPKRLINLPIEIEAEFLYEDIVDFFEDPIGMGTDDDEDDEDQTEADRIISESNRIYGNQQGSNKIEGFFLFVCITSDKSLYDALMGIVYTEWFDTELDVSVYTDTTTYESFAEFDRQLWFPGDTKSKGMRRDGPIVNGPSGNDLN